MVLKKFGEVFLIFGTSAFSVALGPQTWHIFIISASELLPQIAVTHLSSTLMPYYPPSFIKWVSCSKAPYASFIYHVQSHPYGLCCSSYSNHILTQDHVQTYGSFSNFTHILSSF